LAGERLADARTGKNGRHALVGMLRQAVFGRLAGYEDVNDAKRLRRHSEKPVRRHPAVDWGIAAAARYIDWVMRSVVTRSIKNHGGHTS